MKKFSKAEIRRKVTAEHHWQNGAKFKGISGNRVLWWDADNELFCVNTFEILDNGDVEFGPMPVESFEP